MIWRFRYEKFFFILLIILFFFCGWVVIELGFIELVGCSLSISFFFDYIREFYVGVVLFITLMVYYFSKVYIGGDYGDMRFSWLVMFFVGSILVVVLSGRLLILFVGWDLLGISSYLLVIYYINSRCARAGYFTALRNRIGDGCIIIVVGFGLVRGFLWSGGELGLLMDVDILVCFLILVCGFTKSAQYPFCA